MKKSIILFSCTFLFMPVFAQFQVSHGIEANEEGYSVRTLNFDEAFIIGGMTDYGYITNSDATLVKTKNDGNLIWSMVYGGEEDEVFNSTRPLDQSQDIGYVNLGTTHSFGYGTNDMFFVRTQPDGTPVVAFTYGGEKGDEGHCIQVVDDEEAGEQYLIMIGETASFTEGAKMFVVKTDLKGNYKDAVIIGNEESNQFGYWIEQTSDGGYIAVGASDYACDLYYDDPNLDIFVVKLKPSLNVEWARTLGGGKDIPLKDIAFSVKEIEEGYIITGTTYSFGVDKTEDAFLLKLDSGGNFKWLRNYGNEGSNGAYDVLNEENSGVNHQYIFTGFSDLDNTTYAWLLATDSDGIIAWTKGYGYEGSQTGKEMDKTLSKGYVFTGIENSFGAGGQGIYQVVTDDIGNSNCPDCELELEVESAKHDPCILDAYYYKHVETGKECEIKYREVDYKTLACGKTEKSTDEEMSSIESTKTYMSPFVAFPNPANTQVEIQYPQEFQYGNLKIYNNIGQLIYEERLPVSNTTQVSLENMNEGIYFITVVSEKGESLTTYLLKSK